jgi:hypothetical protein
MNSYKKIDVFISYSHQDHLIAEKIEKHLKPEGIIVWRDVRLSPGVKFEGEIQSNLRDARICLVLLSQASLDSEYCQNEVGFAIAHDITILPCRLDQSRPLGFLSSRTYMDFSNGIVDFSTNNSQPSLFDLYWDIRSKLIDLRQNDLRLYLVDFYRRLVTLLENAEAQLPNNITALTPYFEKTTWGTELHYTKHSINVLPSDYHKIVLFFLDYLDKNDYCKTIYNNEVYGNYLPIWLIPSSSIKQFGGTTIFQVIPDALIGFTTEFIDGDVIEASIYLPTMPKENNRDEPIANLITSSILYKSVQLEDAKKLEWLDMIKGGEIYVLSRGVFRLSNTFSRHNGTNIVLSKYLGIEATQLRLSGDQANYANHRLSTNILQMMYIGWFSGIIEFLLFNDSESIAIVRNLRVIIHKVASRPVEELKCGAGLSEYRFKVTLQPDAKEIAVTTQQFKYSPGDIDKFSIEYHSSEPGYDYEVSLKIDWFDVRLGTIKTIETPREVAEFPNYGFSRFTMIEE